jgi:tRNA(Ile2)-agmatinylcytidine synthase
MQSTIPETFSSYDNDNKRVLITPHGPDPVFYGIRGETAKSVVKASTIVNVDEKLDGYMVFKSNQGTGDHLKNKLQVNDLKPYTSGFLVGDICSKPVIQKGGHVLFSLQVEGRKIRCAVYKPTKITQVASALIVGDKIKIGGGVRKASKNYGRVINVEFLDVLQLGKHNVSVNPTCRKCNKRMKSKGTKQGFECIKCGHRAFSKVILELPRKIECRLYIPSVSAHRHLTRPYQRIQKRNKYARFNTSIPWVCVF